MYDNVHLFIKRAKQSCLVKDPPVVRNNLQLSLRGQALEWWTRRLDTERRLVTYSNGVE